jgi:uncharacterized CHY-type Zn-finger protein
MSRGQASEPAGAGLTAECHASAVIRAFAKLVGQQLAESWHDRVDAIGHAVIGCQQWFCCLLQRHSSDEHVAVSWTKAAASTSSLVEFHCNSINLYTILCVYQAS